MNENIPMNGNVFIRKYSKKGFLKSYQVVKNHLTEGFMNNFLRLMNPNSNNSPDLIKPAYLVWSNSRPQGIIKETDNTISYREPIRYLDINYESNSEGYLIMSIRFSVPSGRWLPPEGKTIRSIALLNSSADVTDIYNIDNKDLIAEVSLYANNQDKIDNPIDGEGITKNAGDYYDIRWNFEIMPYVVEGGNT